MKLSIHSKSYAKKFSNVFTNLSTLTDSVSMFFRDEGLYIQGMDNSHISLYEANFDKSWFTTYKRDKTEAEKITVNLEYFKLILSTRGDEQGICLEYKGSSPDKLSITFRTVGKKTKEFPREYEMNLMDVDDEMLEIPTHDYSIAFYMETKMFSPLIKQLSMFDETLVVNCNENDINFRTKGTEGSMSVNLMDGEQEFVDQFEIEEDYNLRIYFSIRYIDNFCAFSKVDERVRLSFSNDFPLEVYYSLEGKEKKEEPKKGKGKKAEEDAKDGSSTVVSDDESNEEPKSWIRFFLAPKMMDDDDVEKYKDNNDDDEDEDEDDE